MTKAMLIMLLKLMEHLFM